MKPITSCRRLDAERIRYAADTARRETEALALLRSDPARRLPRLHGLQPHVPADRLRRSRGRIRGAAERRDGVGRLGRAQRRDLRARRLPFHELADAARSIEMP